MATKQNRRKRVALKAAQEIGAILRQNEGNPEVAEALKKSPPIQQLAGTFQANPELILKALEILDRKYKKG